MWSPEIFPRVSRKKSEEQMWWVGESLAAVAEVFSLSEKTSETM